MSALDPGADHLDHDDDGYYDDYDDDYGDGGWEPPRRGRHGRPRRRRRPVLTVLLALVVVSALIVVGVGLHLKGEISPGGKPGKLVDVTIPKGSTDRAIGQRLAAAGVISGPSLFHWYVSLRHDGPFQPGSYRLAEHESYSAAIAALKQGPPVVVDHLVVPEGYTLAEIAQRVQALPGMHLQAATFLTDATTGVVRSPYEPAGVNSLEGLVFPATYDVSPPMTEADVLRLMVQKFDDVAASLDLTGRAAALGVTPYQVVTVASIIEREAKLAGDRPGVASAIYNRLHIGMALGADSTLVYALRLANPALDPSKVDYETPSPYNTRLNKGLPPTPIANPGLPSLTAAANPPTTTNLYFVEVDPDGQLAFASNSAGFAKLQAQCRAARLC